MRTAILLAPVAETPPRETRPVLAYADVSDFAELRRFRASVFADELGIQDPEYQDVFNDHFSKNVVLRRGPALKGAVRLAYSHESRSFYISYLALHPSYRNRARLALLLGAILHLMRENDIALVSGHATESNLAMYLSIGCAATGPSFRKYGFHCEWTPIEYRLGTNGSAEDRLVNRARQDLSDADAGWEFTPRVVICPTERVYAEVVRRLIATREIFGTIPHLGRRLPDFVMPPHIRGVAVVAPHDVRPGIGDRFDHYNARLDRRRTIVARAESSFAALARAYAVLLGRHAVFADEWATVRLASTTRDVQILAGDGEAAAARAAVATRHDEAHVRVTAAGGAAEMSARLLREYVDSLGPAAAEP